MLKSPTMIVGSLQSLGPAGHALDEIELLTEFRILLAVGDVAAGGDIDILDPDSALEPRADMARLAIVLPVVAARIGQRHPAQDRHTMMHALAVQLLVDIAEAREQIGREGVVAGLGFLKAKDVGLLVGDQPLDQRRAGADRIDIPRSDLEAGHGRTA